MITRNLWYFGLLVVVAAATGCAATEKNAAVERAQSVYAEASNQPDVVANAPVHMHEAQQNLTKALQAESEADKEHLAYLAEKQSRMAMTASERESARREADQLTEERQQLLLESREREAQLARQQALTSQQELERTRQQSRTIEQELAAARARGEEKTQQLEEALRQSQAREQELKAAAQKAAQMRAQELQQMQKELSALQAEVKQTGRGMVLTLSDVLFATGKAELLPGALRTIQELAGYLKKHPERQLVVEGHTDNVGDAGYNLELSQRRADSVSLALQQQGIEAGRISTKGFGEEFPVASNANPGGRQQNRRVEIVILDQSGEAAGQTSGSTMRPRQP